MSSNGSTAVEFSGQSTKSGLRLIPRRDLVGQPHGRVDVVAGDLAVVEQDVVAVAGHVALDDGDRAVPSEMSGEYGTRAGGHRDGEDRRGGAGRDQPGPARG